MFENIAKFFKKLIKSESKEAPSKETAKERLHLVLMQDRANVSADFLELMKQEIIEVIKKYIDVEESAIDVRLTNEINEDGTTGAPSLYANIPIKKIKNEMKKEVKAENKDQEKTENKENKEKDKKEEKQNEEEESKNKKEEPTNKDEKENLEKEENKKTSDVSTEDKNIKEKEDAKKEDKENTNNKEAEKTVEKKENKENI